MAIALALAAPQTPILDRERDIDADRLATEAFRAHRRKGLPAVLLDFARRIGEARDRFALEAVAPAEKDRGEKRRGDRWILALLGIIVLVVGGAALARRRHVR